MESEGRRMKKKCLSCGAPFTLSGSGKLQKYCPQCAKRGDGRIRGLSASNPLKTKGAEQHFSAPIPPPETGSFITPQGERGRIWTSARKRKGEEAYWRINIADCPRERRCGFTEWRKSDADIIRIERNSHVPLTRLTPNPPARDPSCVQADTWPRPWGYKVRLYIEAEEELQQLGCGWRTVIIELDGPRVHLHHNGRIATMKRDAFKALLARNKRHKRPQLKLVVSNPLKPDERLSNAA